MRIKQLFIGKPKTVGRADAAHPMDREWTSGIFKEPVSGPVWLGKEKLAGDGQADLVNHGGLEKAVFCYPSEHYTYWQRQHQIEEMYAGGMGENFSLDGGIEADLSVGDIFSVGDAVVQVSQPRQPCWKPARRFRRKDLALLLQDSGKTGWYFRVLQEGEVAAGQQLTLIDRPTPEWTIETCNRIMHHDKQNFELAAALASCDYLAASWKRTLLKRVEKQQASSIEKRVYGPNMGE